MNQLLEVCHCGHAKATHHEEWGQCLGLGCNTPSDDWENEFVDNFCPFYRDRNVPDTWEGESIRPDHIDICRCYECKKYLGIIKGKANR